MGGPGGWGAMVAELAVECVGVCKSYDGKANAVDRVDLRLAQGEFLGLIGPNGGGKTTLLKLILGTLAPTSGSVRVMGMHPDEARRRGVVAAVAQRDTAVRPFPLTPIEAIRLVSRRVTSADALQCLELVGASPFAERPVGQLSGGQWRRVQIARALAVQPSVLVLDEPMVGIDEPGQRQIGEAIQRIHRELGVAVLLVSHDLRALAGGAGVACDRVACLRGHLHYHAAPSGITPQVLAEVFEHDLTAVFGDVHIVAHRAEECPGDHSSPKAGGCEHP